MKPKAPISVIIPMYNAEKTIAQALESIKQQTVDSSCFQIIIINDGSTDNSTGVVENFMAQNPEMNINVIHQTNQGVSAARNRGLETAEGKYIALLDADDQWLAEKTKRQMNYLQNDDIDFISCDMMHYKLLFPYHSKKDLIKVTFRKILFRNSIQPSTVIFKKKIYNQCGGFKEGQNYAEDANYWLTISEKFNMYILNQKLIIAGGGKRTFGVSGLSANINAMAQGFQANLQDMLRCKRINYIEYIAYSLFYRAKHLLLIFRNFYYQNFSKK